MFDKLFGPKVMRVDDKVRDEWGSMPREDFEIVKVQYQRETLKKISTILGWVQFFGIVLILYIILQLLNFLMSF